MFIYNITTQVNTTIVNDWIKWQKAEHIPEIMGTNLFNEFKFYRLLDQDDSDGHTYIIQFFTTEKDNYHHYIKTFSPAFKEKAKRKWGDRFISFRTLLQHVQ